MSESQLDLSKLALERPAAQIPGRQGWLGWGSRYAFPTAILVGFVTLLGFAGSRQLMPKRSVTACPVIAKRGVSQKVGTPLFQAAGWVEPRPTPVEVAALAPGVIEELLVVAGQSVRKGDPIARLIRVDAELAVAQERATLAFREAELQRAEAELSAAIMQLEQPVHLKSQLAEAQSMLAKATTEMEKLPFLVKAAAAKAAFTKSSLEGKRGAGTALARVVIAQAIQDDASARAELEELEVRGPNLQHEIDALKDRVSALDDLLKLRIQERRQVNKAKAELASAAAQRDQARLSLQQAELTLERTVVRASIDGRILRLIASPGTRVMGMGRTGGHSPSTIVEMYDPSRLQVRADVRLEDVPLVTRGASVVIETASSGNSINGRVLQSTSTANIQKNTLEVKIELIDPPSTVSPEMLVTATFLAPATEAPKDTHTETVQLFVPKQLIHSNNGSSFVWTIDADNKAIRKTVKLGGVDASGLAEITDGLNITDKIIVTGTEGLKPNSLVQVVGEDQMIGTGE